MLNKTMMAAIAAVMLGSVGSAFAAPRSESTNVNVNTPAYDNRAAAPARVEDRKVVSKTKAHKVAHKKAHKVAKAKAHKRGVHHAKAHKPVVHHAKAHSTHSSKSIHRVNNTPAVESTQTREQRMAQARANWERNRRM